MSKQQESHKLSIFAMIFQDFWDSFKSRFASYDTAHHDKQIESIISCADPESGFTQYMCLNCGKDSKIIAHSCKSKFCVRCGRVEGENFAKSIAEKLHKDVNYRHLVLTLPSEFRGLFYKNRNESDLFDSFYAAGWSCVQDLMNEISGDKVECGCLIVLHTVGRKCDYKPHMHVMLIAGGITSTGNWFELDKFRYKLLHRIWKKSLLSALREWDVSGANANLIDHVDKKHKVFVAHIDEKKAPKRRRSLIRYLSKYLCRPQISLRRISSYNPEEGSVTYTFQSHESGKRETEQIDVISFIGRMVQQILPKGFRRIRYYGLQSAQNVTRLKAKVATALGRLMFEDQPKELPRRGKESYRDLIIHWWDEDPLRCRNCGHQMEVVRVWIKGKGFVYDQFERIFGKDIGPPGLLPRFLESS